MDKNNLPSEIAVFPLSNAVFFPRTILPLNIFEDRYLQLVSDVFKESRLFGMIQPKSREGKSPETYQVGCLGKIISFNETSDKRYIISLSGITRFKITKEINSTKLYRRFKVDYNSFTHDLEPFRNEKVNYDKNNLLNKIKIFFRKKDYSFELDELMKLNFDQLISTTCMISPFTVQEKQKLIEAIKIEDRLKILEEIINFNLLDFQENKTIQ
jgi:uncharacterized protein